MAEIPNTVEECGGCEEDLNLLNPHLVMQIKATRKVLVVEEEVSADPNVVGDGLIYLGDKSGRGRIVRFHDFGCIRKYANERKDNDTVIETYHQDEVYVPFDNRDPEELVKDGELPEEMLAVFAASAKEGGQE
jgi:hypothetical protein